MSRPTAMDLSLSVLSSDAEARILQTIYRDLQEIKQTRQQESEGVVENPCGDIRELYTCRKCGESHWFGEARPCEGVVVEITRLSSHFGAGENRALYRIDPPPDSFRLGIPHKARLTRIEGEA